MHNGNVDITWDPKKTEANFRKHRIRFSDAEVVLFDPMALTIEDQIVEQEHNVLLLLASMPWVVYWLLFTLITVMQFV